MWGARPSAPRKRPECGRMALAGGGPQPPHLIRRHRTLTASPPHRPRGRQPRSALAPAHQPGTDRPGACPGLPPGWAVALWTADGHRETCLPAVPSPLPPQWDTFLGAARPESGGQGCVCGTRRARWPGRADLPGPGLVIDRPSRLLRGQSCRDSPKPETLPNTRIFRAVSRLMTGTGRVGRGPRACSLGGEPCAAQTP